MAALTNSAPAIRSNLFIPLHYIKRISTTVRVRLEALLARGRNKPGGFIFKMLVSRCAAGILAPIEVVMLPEALAPVRWRSI